MDKPTEPAPRPPDTREVTRCLRRFSDGEAGAFDDVVSLVYEDLRSIARRQLRRARFGPSLDTTGLVHEVYLKMVDQTRARWQDRRHFFAISARAMRQIIVDYARQRSAKKRGGGVRPEGGDEIEEVGVVARQEAEYLLTLNEALESLGDIDERMLRVVECRYFAGLSEQETADSLDVSVRTVQRAWKRARAWLKEEMGPSS